MPGGIAELEGRLDAGGQERQHRAQPLGLRAEARRQLEQQRTEPRTQPLGPRP